MAWFSEVKIFVILKANLYTLVMLNDKQEIKEK